MYPFNQANDKTFFNFACKTYIILTCYRQSHETIYVGETKRDKAVPGAKQRSLIIYWVFVSKKTITKLIGI